MAHRYPELNDKLTDFIRAQKVFFVGTAALEGRVNVSPKGLDSLRVLAPDRVVWLNLTGSGNETAAHLQQVTRMTLMFCAFEGKPLILRLYGEARLVGPGDPEWRDLMSLFGSNTGARQVIDLKVDLVQTSCGFGVPLYDYVGEREQLREWAEKKGEEGIRQYWWDKNRRSIDGKAIEILRSREP